MRFAALRMAPRQATYALNLTGAAVTTPNPVIEIAAGNAIRTDTLADRSVIVLNKTSTLRLAEGYNRRERRMRLSGEARFAVQPDKEKPFVVEVEALEVRVVGTEFTVEDTPQGVLLRPRKPLFPETRLEDGLGCAGYQGPPRSLEEIDRLLEEDIRREWGKT